jgi:hypothetical protein
MGSCDAHPCWMLCYASDAERGQRRRAQDFSKLDGREHFRGYRYSLSFFPNHKLRHLSYSKYEKIKYIFKMHYVINYIIIKIKILNLLK